MWTFLPDITAMFPGCGITIHNVYSTPFQWWRRYAQLALNAQKAEAEQERSRGR